MGWALWLLAPAGVTVCAAIGSWLRARPRRPPSTQEAMRAHDDFLAAIARPARGSDRAQHGPPGD